MSTAAPSAESPPSFDVTQYKKKLHPALSMSRYCVATPGRVKTTMRFAEEIALVEKKAGSAHDYGLTALFKQYDVNRCDSLPSLHHRYRARSLDVKKADILRSSPGGGLY